MAATKVKIRAVVVVAFEPDAGPIPGEFRYFREREGLTQELTFPAGYRALWLSERGVLGIVTGAGATRAAASIMALGLDPRFDLREALWLVSGVAGVDPERGSLGSVLLAEYVIEGSFAHEIDAREIPSNWPDGFVPIGKSAPYEEPRAPRFNGDDGLVFKLDSELVAWAYHLCEVEPLLDTDRMADRRVQFLPAGTAQRPPRVLCGDELSSTTFWHGRLLRERARRWVAYQTDGRATYAMTAMEDTGILQSLTFLGNAGLVDFSRVLIARGISNFDGQREGITAAASLAETKVTSYSAYLPALENAWRVGHRLLEAWLVRS